MNTLGNETATEHDSLECAVTSYATTRLTYDAVNALRKQSDTLPGALGNSVLRHSDEQTLTALVAVKDAISRFKTPSEGFQNWGVVFSTRYLGRTAFAQALNKFAVDGPWNVSVQVVPNRSLHSPASMLGLALGCHGPCVGVGGGLDGEPDAWMTAISLLDQQSLPGIWLVFSGWEPDERIDIEGTPLTETSCTTLALALQPASTANPTARLRIVYDQFAPIALEVPAKTTAMTLFENFIASGSEQPLTAMLGGGLRAEMNWSNAVPSTIPLLRPNSTSLKKAA
ncbi:MAG: hypothetical protein WCH39_01030 [Schlesneria sp.]